jgi:hypothetical protein
MPAMLSVIPAALPVAPAFMGAFATGTRPAQAAHVAAPSGICVPHMLQKAIEVSSLPP